MFVAIAAVDAALRVAAFMGRKNCQTDSNIDHVLVICCGFLVTIQGLKFYQCFESRHSRDGV